MAPSLAPIRSSTKIDMYSELVGMAGFEPAASCSQSRRANQAAPHPAGPIRSLPSRPPCPPPRDAPVVQLPRRSLVVARLIEVAVRPDGPVTGTLTVLTGGEPGFASGHAGVAQWQSPSLPSWS
jgi:hypothetical protein